MADFEPEFEKDKQEISQSSESNTVTLDTNNKKDHKFNFSKEIVDYLEIFIFALGFVVLLFSFCFRLCSVSGDSMTNTLYDGESVIVTDLFYKPTRGDIIVFHDTNELKKPLVKRVIATEGETVKITYFEGGMDVFITDKSGKSYKYSEPYVNYTGNGGKPYPAYGSVGETYEYTVPENKIFVMGDNRNESKDSRDSSVGYIDERTVLGKVIFQVTPFEKFGLIGNEDY